MMAWIFLLVSGAAEIGFVISMKLSQGFRRPKPTVAVVLFAGASFYCLSRALQAIPISTAYGIWTGIGAAGSVLVGMWLFRESRDVRKLLFISMIITGVVGLKLVG